MKAIRNVVRAIVRHPVNRGHELQALARAVAWQVRRRVISTPRTLTIYGDVQVRCDTDSRDSSSLVYFKGWKDPTEMSFTQRYLRPGDGYVDCGANIGVYTLLARRCVGPSGRVVAYEPSSGTFTRLQRNVTLNQYDSNVTLVRKALADKPGQLAFTAGYDTGNRLSHLGREDLPSEVVEVTTLDQDLPDGSFAMWKIDVEAAEVLVLRGASRRLAKAETPVIQLEISARLQAQAGFSVDELTGILGANGYGLWDYDYVENKLSPWINRPREFGLVGDAFAIHQGSLDFVKERLSTATA